MTKRTHSDSSYSGTSSNSSSADSTRPVKRRKTLRSSGVEPRIAHRQHRSETSKQAQGEPYIFRRGALHDNELAHVTMHIERLGKDWDKIYEHFCKTFAVEPRCADGLRRAYDSSMRRRTRFNGGEVPDVIPRNYDFLCHACDEARDTPIVPTEAVADSYQFESETAFNAYTRSEDEYLMQMWEKNDSNITSDEWDKIVDDVNARFHDGRPVRSIAALRQRRTAHRKSRPAPHVPAASAIDSSALASGAAPAHASAPAKSAHVASVIAAVDPFDSDDRSTRPIRAPAPVSAPPAEPVEAAPVLRDTSTVSEAPVRPASSRDMTLADIGALFPCGACKKTQIPVFASRDGSALFCGPCGAEAGTSVPSYLRAALKKMLGANYRAYAAESATAAFRSVAARVNEHSTHLCAKFDADHCSLSNSFFAWSPQHLSALLSGISSAKVPGATEEMLGASILQAAAVLVPNAALFLEDSARPMPQIVRTDTARISVALALSPASTLRRTIVAVSMAQPPRHPSK